LITGNLEQLQLVDLEFYQEKVLKLINNIQNVEKRKLLKEHGEVMQLILLME
jgi:hypothetical protein